MASIWKEVIVEAAPERVWNAVRDFGAAHERLFPGILTDVQPQPGGRVVTFADGQTYREPLFVIDETHHRIAWTAEGGPLAHHHASIEVIGDGKGPTRIVWITDVLPDTAAPAVSEMVEGGAAAMKKALEQA